MEDVKTELEQGSDPFTPYTIIPSQPIPSFSGFTALHFAAFLNPDPAVSALLIDVGADLEGTAGVYKSTPLHLAAGGFGMHGRASLLIVLNHCIRNLELPPSLDHMRSCEKELEYEYKVLGNRPEVVELFLDRGADIQARDSKGATPLHRAAAGNNDIGVITLLVNRGAIVQMEDDFGFIPLHRAMMNSNSQIANFLLKHHGEDVEMRIENGMTLLHFSALNWNPEIAALLLKHGARIDAVNNEIQTPLHIASEINVLPYVVELLLDHGADTEIEDEMGRTPLNLALRSKRTRFSAITLIERGANMDTKDKEGRSARDIKPYWIKDRFYLENRQ